MRHELVEWRINEANGDGTAVHGLENSDEVTPLVRQEFRQRIAAGFRTIRYDHLLNRELPIVALFRLLEILEEHVLGATEPDALGAHFARFLSVVRGIGVRAHSELPNLIGPAHERLVGLGQAPGSRDPTLPRVNGAFTAVEREPVALLHDEPARLHQLSCRNRCPIFPRRRCNTFPSRAPQRPRGWSCRRWR